jgi:hypothetical protein
VRRSLQLGLALLLGQWLQWLRLLLDYLASLAALALRWLRWLRWLPWLQEGLGSALYQTIAQANPTPSRDRY